MDPLAAKQNTFNPGFTDRVYYTDSPLKNFAEELLHIRG